MNVLVIGSGGREHALVWKLRQSQSVKNLYCASGNPGIEQLAECVSIMPAEKQKLLTFALGNHIDLVVVGPEQPLAAGIVDLFRENNVAIFGPTQAAARLESSKVWAKQFMVRHSIPTALHGSFRRDQQAEAARYAASLSLPLVVKADGLAAGKGVVICLTSDDVRVALDTMFQEHAFGSAGDAIVIEEFLDGIEASVFAVTDGKRFAILAPAQDHKRVFDDDKGKNTGGMGAFAPTPIVTPGVLSSVESKIIEPTLAGMTHEGCPFTGCLYVGLMLTKDGPKVIEFNCRFGDPETQVVLPLYEGDLFELLYSSATGRVTDTKADVQAVRGSSVCVVLASRGYPDSFSAGYEISGLAEAGSMPGVTVFHAGTKPEQGSIVTAGGRVLGVTATVSEGSLENAIEKVYEAVQLISFQGMHYRHDIGRKTIEVGR